MKNVSLTLAKVLCGVFVLNISACNDPETEIDPVKSVTIQTQSGTLVEGKAGEATYAVTTENIADDVAGSVTWYETPGSETAIDAPSGIAASATDTHDSAASVTITADAGAKEGVYYFRVYFDGAGSQIATLTVGEALPEGALPGEEYGIETVKINAGTFLMGSPLSEPNREDGATDPRKNNEVQHEVTLTQDFYIGKYEVTNTQYAAFLNDKQVQGTEIEEMYEVKTVGNCTWGDNDGKRMIHDSSCYSWMNRGVHWDGSKWAPVPGYENYPVIGVTWYGAFEFAEWVGGSLPTEAQWEYAARGGVEAKPFGIGDGTRLTGDMANFYVVAPYDVAEGGQYDDNEAMPRDVTDAVGTYPFANGYGLYDMHGNVWEWCSDWFDTNYGSANAADAVTDPTGSESSEWNYKVLKGGSYYDFGKYCRSAYREFANIEMPQEIFGFRVVFVQ